MLTKKTCVMKAVHIRDASAIKLYYMEFDWNLKTFLFNETPIYMYTYSMALYITST